VGNRNARLVIPLAVGVWLLAVAATFPELPGALRRSAEIASIVAVMVGVPLVIGYLMGDAGWLMLREQFPPVGPFRGQWQPCPTAQMARVPMDHPDFRSSRLRLTSMLRVGVTEDALHLGTWFFWYPWVTSLLQIPWSAVRSWRPFDAPGWVDASRDPGALVQATYDPGYRGPFVELEIGEPPVYLQLPRVLVEPALPRLRPSGADGLDDRDAGEL
jgi:hypothetical protein